eukprot:13843231-Alexandrium_andersonii.AAC.1
MLFRPGSADTVNVCFAGVRTCLVAHRQRHSLIRPSCSLRHHHIRQWSRPHTPRVAGQCALISRIGCMGMLYQTTAT